MLGVIFCPVIWAPPCSLLLWPRAKAGSPRPGCQGGFCKGVVKYRMPALTTALPTDLPLAAAGFSSNSRICLAQEHCSTTVVATPLLEVETQRGTWNSLGKSLCLSIGSQSLPWNSSNALNWQKWSPSSEQPWGRFLRRPPISTQVRGRGRSGGAGAVSCFLQAGQWWNPQGGGSEHSEEKETHTGWSHSWPRGQPGLGSPSATGARGSPIRQFYVPFQRRPAPSDLFNKSIRPLIEELEPLRGPPILLTPTWQFMGG